MKCVDNKKILIIPYGNPLRGDDAIGWKAGERLVEMEPGDECDIAPVHQLTPEMAEKISRSETTVFVDASAEGEPGRIECREIEPRSKSDAFAYHTVDPESLLALAEKVYGERPKSFLVTMAGENFDFGEELSTTCADQLPRLIQTIRNLVEQNMT